MTRTQSLLATAFGLAVPSFAPALAMEQYVEGGTYSGGAEVCYLGDSYLAKWWAGPNDRPTDVDQVAFPWDTPWERTAVNAQACAPAEPDNQPPTVSASVSENPADPSGFMPVDLIADASDADGDALRYTWTQVPTAAPSINLTQADQPVAHALLPAVTQAVIFAFQVAVDDGQTTTVASVEVRLEPSGFNQAPLAHAVADPTEVIGTAEIQLSAAGSSDPDGDPLSYRWQQRSPLEPQALFSDPDAAAPWVSLPEPSSDLTFVFEVAVSDGELSSLAQASVIQRAGDEPIACPSWDPAIIYLSGDLVSHRSQTWQAGWWTRGEEPGTTGQWGVWRLTEADTQCNGTDPVDPDTDPDDPNPESSVLLSSLLAREAALTDRPLMAAVKASIATLDNAAVERISPLSQNNPSNVRRVESIVAEPDWEYLFPRRAPAYSYTNFLKAIGKFPAFCGDQSESDDPDAICRKALATLFAHFTQETGGHTPAWPEPEWRQGLVYLRELGWSEDMANGYGLCDPGTWQGATWPCAVFPAGHPSAGQFKSYFGRGAKQLSYNYNYGPFSEAMFGDVNTLLEQPNLVADTWLNLASAVFFYVYPQPPKPSMLHVLDGTWQPNDHDLANGLSPGFGATTQIINGGIECGGTTEHIQSQNRIDYYLEFAEHLNVPVPDDEVLGCANMQRFDSSGAAALPIYWEQDWTAPNACQLVSYQTPFSALQPGDYARCVEHHFNVEIIDDL